MDMRYTGYVGIIHLFTLSHFVYKCNDPWYTCIPVRYNRTPLTGDARHLVTLRTYHYLLLITVGELLLVDKRIIYCTIRPPLYESFSPFLCINVCEGFDQF